MVSFLTKNDAKYVQYNEYFAFLEIFHSFSFVFAQHEIDIPKKSKQEVWKIEKSKRMKPCRYGTE